MSQALTQKKKMTTASMLFLGMVASSIALSIASAWETFIGLRDLMGEGFINSIMAGTLTFGVQMLLFVISWSLAEHYREGFKANRQRWAIWLMCAMVSGFFSYFGFFETNGGRNDPTRWTAVSQERSEMLAEIDTQMELEFDTAQREELTETGDFKIWTDGLNAVIEKAKTAEADIQKNAANREKELVQEQRVIRARRLNAETLRETVAKAVEDITQELEALRASDAALKEANLNLKNEVVEIENQLVGLAAKEKTECKTGIGPRCKAVRRDQTSVQSNLDGKLALIAANESKLDDLQPDLEAAELRVQNNPQQKRLNEIDAEIKTDELALKKIQSELDKLTDGGSFDFIRQNSAMEASLSDLQRRKYGSYQDLVDQCRTIVEQLNLAGVGAQLGKVECDNAGVNDAVRDLTAMQKSLNAFRTDCIENQPLYEKTETGSYVIDGVIDHLDACVQRAPASVRSTMIDRVTALKSSRGDDLQPFTKAGVALADLQSNALIAAVFAAIVDLLVLFCAFVGKTVGQPETVRAIDKLMGLMRRPSPPREGFEAEVSLPGDANAAIMLDQVINRLLRDGFAEYEEEEDGGMKLLLRTGARAHLVQLRGEHIAEGENLLLHTAQAEKSRSQGRTRGSRPRPPI